MLESVTAVVVNHNTSRFAEIAVRSLALAAERAGSPVQITVVDNHSTDDTGDLRTAVAECAADWELSRWPAGAQTLTTHGDVLRDFVLARPTAAGFLFVESDICFHQPDALAVMVRELAGEPEAWAVQARLLTGRMAGAATFRENLLRKRRPIESTTTLVVENDEGVVSTARMRHVGRRMPRCHPGTALIRNSEPFQLAARHLGLSAAWNWSNDLGLGGLNDTLSLVSQAMRTHRYRHLISSAAVTHFWHGTRAGFTPYHQRLVDHLRDGDTDRFVAACHERLEPADS